MAEPIDIKRTEGLDLNYDPVQAAAAVGKAANDAVLPLSAKEADPILYDVYGARQFFNGSRIMSDALLSDYQKARFLAANARRKSKLEKDAAAMPSAVGAQQSGQQQGDKDINMVVSQLEAAIGRGPKNPYSAPSKPDAPVMPGLEELDLESIPDQLKSFALGRLVTGLLTGQDPAEVITDALAPIRQAKAKLGANYEQAMKGYEIDMEKYRYDMQSYNTMLNAYIRGADMEADFKTRLESEAMGAVGDILRTKAAGQASERVAQIKAEASQAIANEKDDTKVLGELIGTWESLNPDARVGFMAAIAEKFPQHSSVLSKLIGAKMSKDDLIKYKTEQEGIKATNMDALMKAQIAKIKSAKRVDDARAEVLVKESQYFKDKLALQAQALSLSGQRLDFDRLSFFMDYGQEQRRYSKDERDSAFKSASDNISTLLKQRSDSLSGVDATINEASRMYSVGGKAEIAHATNLARQVVTKLIAANGLVGSAEAISEDADMSGFGKPYVPTRKHTSRDIPAVVKILESDPEGKRLLKELDEGANPTRPQPGR